MAQAPPQTTGTWVHGPYQLVKGGGELREVPALHSHKYHLATTELYSFAHNVHDRII